MPKHVVVDGSNIATEGRDRPSLRQLNEAVLAFMTDHPDLLVTVVVDATFGHRIDPKEVAEFDAAVSNNELVAPPAGAIGRGDGFVLSIANKVGAVILTNDSYQEFHAEYPWLFDEGRLIGGKPVPHIGWVFVKRLPVRGPTSRKVTAEAKRKDRPAAEPKQPKPQKNSAAQTSAAEAPTKRAAKPSVDASQPMPVPTALPPNATLPPKAPQVNELLPFLSFVEAHPQGSTVDAVVDHYSSHGAYVRLGELMGYVPLRLMADPAPRSAREFMKVGETVSLVVERFIAEKRSVDLAVPGMATAAAPAAPKPPRGRKKQDAQAVPPQAPTPVPEQPAPAKPTKKAAAKQVAPAPVPEASAQAAPKKAASKKVASKKAAATNPEPEKVPAKKASAKKVPAKKVTAEKVPAEKVPAEKVAPKGAAPATKVDTKQRAPRKAAAAGKESAATTAAAPSPAPRRGRTKA